MKFLVILICLIINYLWLKDFDRFDDSWFFRFRCQMANLSTKISRHPSTRWVLGTSLAYLIPLFALGVILYLVAGQLYGLPTMLVHILVLLVAFDRIQPGKLAREFLEKWKAEDIQACMLYLKQELAMPEALKIDDEEALSEYFSKQLVYRSFEKMFVMFFWYIVGGPIGIIFCYVSYQLRDLQIESVARKKADERECEQEAEITLITNLIWLLEWMPMRLLAITFSLIGNFVRCFENLKKSFWSAGVETSSVDLLYGYASCALSGMVGPDMPEADAGGNSKTRERLQKVARIQALLALLERSQAVWLILLAIFTVYA
ncbi:MAG TPA: regulatory signaling modulator protein AmpE [Gammaproteobacteria bacterium]|mgnify:FL=1|jgi:AmpE protein|nr:regulatory signaling modulator protein AmpE [Gammaproteobacteria bacterium]HIL62563.1 regulatory signaling modulator protein AmpE [Porticoccaceae bacterium]